MTETRTCTFYDKRRRLRCTECGVTVDLCQCVDVDEMANDRHTSLEAQFLREVYGQSQLPGEGHHILERVVGQLGVCAMKLSNNMNHEIADSEIRLELVRLAAEVTVLATQGTPEYSYPSG